MTFSVIGGEAAYGAPAWYGYGPSEKYSKLRCPGPPPFYGVAITPRNSKRIIGTARFTWFVHGPIRTNLEHDPNSPFSDGAAYYAYCGLKAVVSLPYSKNYTVYWLATPTTPMVTSEVSRRELELKNWGDYVWAYQMY